jgi:hypothetical protein
MPEPRAQETTCEEPCWLPVLRPATRLARRNGQVECPDARPLARLGGATRTLANVPGAPVSVPARQ